MPHGCSRRADAPRFPAGDRPEGTPDLRHVTRARPVPRGGLFCFPGPGVAALGTIDMGGGLPIKVGNDTIGAIAVSGAPGWDMDEACAKAGLDKVADKLK